MGFNTEYKPLNNYWSKVVPLQPNYAYCLIAHGLVY